MKKKVTKPKKKKIPFIEKEDFDWWLNRLKMADKEVEKQYEASFKDYKQSSLNAHSDEE